MTDSERKCAGCGLHDSRNALERFVMMEDTVIFDMRKKAPGRGAHVHATPTCLERAIHSGFAKSFRAKVEVKDSFTEQFTEGIFQRLKEAFRVSFRSGDLVFGGESVASEMKKNKIAFLVLAADSGESVTRKFEANAERKSILSFRGISGSVLGTILGKDYISVLGISAKKSERIHQDLENLNKMGFWDADLNPVSNMGIGIANGEEQILEEIVGREYDRT